jgi:UDP-glucose/GDP-mannose dehydrogenase family, NAD binding domain
MKTGIAGHGVVGSAMARFFARHNGHHLSILDKYRPRYNTDKHQQDPNSSDLIFVCVPTPTGSDGFACDTSAVEECLEWLLPPVCIRSTIVPGQSTSSPARPENASPSARNISANNGHPWHAEGACGFLVCCF